MRFKLSITNFLNILWECVETFGAFFFSHIANLSCTIIENLRIMECHILLNQFNSFYAVWPKMKFYFLWNSYISFRVSYHIFLYTFLLFRAYFSSKFSIFSCKGRHIRRHCTKACPHFLTRGSLSRVWKYLRRGACTAIFRPPPLPPPFETYAENFNLA